MSTKHEPEPGLDLATRALDVMPGGVSHDGRQLEPSGLFIRSGEGPRKTGIDNSSYIDFACGNGSLIFGHCHKPAMAAAANAIAAGFHFSAGTETELRWAEQVRTLMPAAQLVRFTSSGNEACLLSFALARAATGRAPVLVLSDHYHGWAAPAVLPKLPLAEFKDRTEAHPDSLIVEAGNVSSAVAALDSGRFGAIIIEPTGASFGKIPLGRAEVHALVGAAKSAGTLCIFDETITGFRVAPGGAQQHFDVAPDLTVLGKILGGGLPCGALVGRRDVMSLLDNRSESAIEAGHVCHMGTGNGNPVVAAVGLVTLTNLADGRAIALADAAAARLRAGLNDVFAEARVAWAAYGTSSGFHIFLNPHGAEINSRRFDAARVPSFELAARDRTLVNDLRIALLAEGIDINSWPGGLLSSAHDAATVDEAVAGFARALFHLRRRDVRLTGWAASP